MTWGHSPWASNGPTSIGAARSVTVRPVGPEASTHATCSAPSVTTLDNSWPRWPTASRARLRRATSSRALVAGAPRHPEGFGAPQRTRQRVEAPTGELEHRRQLLGLGGDGATVLAEHAPSRERRQHGVESVGHLGQRVDEPRPVGADEPPSRLGYGAQAAGGDLHAERLGHHVLDGVRLVEHHDVVFGEDGPVAGDVGGVEVGVHHDHVGSRGALARLLGEADRARRAPEGPRALSGGHRHRRPGAGVGLEFELGTIPGGRGVGPGDEPA